MVKVTKISLKDILMVREMEKRDGSFLALRQRLSLSLQDGMYVYTEMRSLIMYILISNSLDTSNMHRQVGILLCIGSFRILENHGHAKPHA